MKTRNNISVNEISQSEELVRELHEKLLQAAITQIKQSTSSMPSLPASNDNPDQRKENAEQATSTPEIPHVLPHDHSGIEKNNEKQNDVVVQSARLILGPEKQNELLEIVKQKSEEFENELSLLPLDESVIDSASQRFKDELTEKVSKVLEPFEQPLKIAGHSQNETRQ